METKQINQSKFVRMNNALRVRSIKFWASRTFEIHTMNWSRRAAAAWRFLINENDSPHEATRLDSNSALAAACCCFQSNYAKHDESRARRAYTNICSRIHAFIHLSTSSKSTRRTQIMPHDRRVLMLQFVVFKESARTSGVGIWLIISHLVISLSDSQRRAHQRLNYDKATLGRNCPFFI